MDFENTKNVFFYFWILKHVCKFQSVLANIPKKYKNLIFWVFILITINIWVKKS